MNYTNIIESIKKGNQSHILRFWKDLTEKQKLTYAEQLSKIDFNQINSLYNLVINESSTSLSKQLKPAHVVSLNERRNSDPAMAKIGENLLRAGKVAAFLVAGGQGSRLGFDGPKGIYPITPVKNKSLFQLHSEKILSMCRYYNTTIPWYIMTSVHNHADTISFFHNNKYFGMEKDNVMFFAQEMIPALDWQGKLILEDTDRVFMSPNGHGGSLKAIWDSKAYEDMLNRGIESLFYFQVDNVLTYICDPCFLGYHKHYKSDMSSKVVRKAFPDEKLGIICTLNDKTAVVEYSDLSKEDANARDETGNLKYWAGSIAIHIINMDFIRTINEKGFKLPYHIARKNIPYLDENGKKINPDKNNGYKFETFVFDALQYCKNTISIEVERSDEFSALKNKTGVDSEETSVRDLNLLYLKWLKKAGLDIPENNDKPSNTEISPLFAFSESGVLLKKEKIPPYSDNFYLE